jgi:hypothetical protein
MVIDPMNQSQLSKRKKIISEFCKLIQVEL